MTFLPTKPNLDLPKRVSRNGTSGMPCGYHLDPPRRYIVHGLKQAAALLRHDDDPGRNGGDPLHDGALGGRRLIQHRVKRGDDRNFESRQQFQDIAARFAAEDSVFVLKANHVAALGVEKFGRPAEIADCVFANLKAHGRRIVVGLAGVGHGDDAGVHVGTRRRDGFMQILSEGGDAAAPREDNCR